MSLHSKTVTRKDFQVHSELKMTRKSLQLASIYSKERATALYYINFCQIRGDAHNIHMKAYAILCSVSIVTIRCLYIVNSWHHHQMCYICAESHVKLI